jgi:uncharacterized protein YggE
MSEKNNLFNSITTIILIILLALNGFLIYRSFIDSSEQSYSPQQAMYAYSTAQSQNTHNQLILVSGIGVAATKPDISILNVGVITQAETATDAQNSNAEAMNNVFNTLQRNGITTSDIETTIYTLEPIMIYPDREETPTIIGYRCRNRLAITLTDISQTGEITDKVVAAGINEVNSIQFRVSDENIQELYEQALQNALQDAYEKAEIVGKTLNVKIIGPLEINIGSSYQPIPIRLESTAKANTPIIPGELSITVQVQVSYQYT